MSPRFLSSLLKPKKALDALLDTMADGLDGHDNYDELGGHGLADGAGRDPYLPENKGTELSHALDVVIPAKDLAQAPDPATAEFFKESDPEFEMSASGIRRVSGRGDSPEWEAIHNILQKHGYRWLGRVSDGTEMWGKGVKERVVYDPASRRWVHQIGGVNDLDGAFEELEEKIKAYDFDQPTPKSSSLKSCVACETDWCIEHMGSAEPWCDGCDHAKANCTCEGCTCPENPNAKKAASNLTTGGKGVDRNGEYDVLDIKGNEITYRYSDGTTQTGDRAIKQRINDGIQAEQSRANQPKKIPGYLQEDEILWTPEMAWFLGYLAGPGKVKIFAEAPPKYEEAVVNKYHDLTGQILEEAPGKFNIAPETKWSPELTVMFKPTDEVPDEISRIAQKPGLVNRNQFAWSLINQGFRIGERPNVDQIRAKVPEGFHDYFDMGSGIEGQPVQASKLAAKTLYHVCRTEKVSDIKQKGILPLQPSNWVQGESNERYGEGEIFAFDNLVDAIKWAAKMDWEFNKKMGTGKISIIMFAPAKGQKWERDTNDPLSQHGAKGKWLKLHGAVKPEQIQGAKPVNVDMTRAAVKGEAVEFEKEADLISYGMGQPLGGSGNPDGGTDDENADDDQNTGLGGLNMTSSDDDEYDTYDYDAEDARLAAEQDAADAEHDKQAAFWASVADSDDDMEIISAKIGSTEESGWFAKSARPNEQKIQLLIKQFKLTPEQIEECIKADPSPNQTDFVAWLAKFLSKGVFKLPEDAPKLTEQLGLFQKLKKSPNFTFSKDIQQYDPPKLFETLEQAGEASLSNKEKKREEVRKGADIVVQQGDITVYKVTEAKALTELSSGTNWCTAQMNMAQHYLPDGPSYVFFDAGSAVAQLHPASNQFMNRADVCILESVTGDSSRFSRSEKKFLADPGMAKALGLLAEKEPNVKAWVMEHVADPEEVKKILGEAATAEVAQNVEYEKEMAQYKIDLAEYEKKFKEFQPKNVKWNKEYEEYQTQLDAWHKRQEEGSMDRLNPGPRPKAPNRPDEPRRPYMPGGGGYGGSYYRDREPAGKKYTMQVRNALATGTALTPEVEAELVGAGVNTQLLLKYGSLFHPGKPWEPLAQSILAKVQKNGTVDKDAIDYAAKFVKGRWPEVEPFLLTKLFLQTRNMENMRTALDYAKRAVRGRWQEFEDKIAKAKPGAASGYGAAEYAIYVVKMPWTRIPGIKRKKNGKINAEECMIVGAPGEARKYAEAFFQGQRWEPFEESALAADNLNAMINYAANTLHARMPALEEKILSGTKDAQEGKGRRRYRKFTDLPLEYATKVIKGRWPEYEVKMLAYIKEQKAETGYGNGEYKPSHGTGRYYNSGTRLPEKVNDYVIQVIKGRWPELEQVLLTRYQEFPNFWVKNQNLLDGYLVALDSGCKQRNKGTPDEEEYKRDTRDEKLKQQPYTRFTQDANCYWPEGEQRLATRDPGFEKVLLDELRKKASDPEYTKDKAEKYIAVDDLMKMSAAPENMSYEDRDKQPSWTIWNGYWIGWYGMDSIEKYTEYMFDNGQDWDVGIGIIEITEKFDDVRGRGSWVVRKNWRRKPEAPATEAQPEQAQMAFSSSLLNRKKKALVEMHESPTMLPPRDDIKRHLDQVEQQEAMNGVMDGVKPNTMRPRVDMIDPRINPDGVVASDCGCAKQADYDEQQDMADEYFLDQVRDAKNEAKRHFMEEDYLQQQAVEDGMSMEELWKLMGEEYTAEFYGYPYHRVEDFTDAQGAGAPGDESFAPKISSESCPMCKSANVRHIDDDAKGYNSGIVLAECQDCRGYYSLLSH